MLVCELDYFKKASPIHYTHPISKQQQTWNPGHFARFLDDLAVPHPRHFDPLPLLKEIYAPSGLTLSKSSAIADGTRAVFLDIQIPVLQVYSPELGPPGLHFGLYGKPGNAYSYLHFDSYTSTSVRKGIVIGLAIRILRRNSEFLNARIDFFNASKLLNQRGYSNRFIASTLQQYLNSLVFDETGMPKVAPPPPPPPPSLLLMEPYFNADLFRSQRVSLSQIHEPPPPSPIPPPKIKKNNAHIDARIIADFSSSWTTLDFKTATAACLPPDHSVVQVSFRAHSNALVYYNRALKKVLTPPASGSEPPAPVVDSTSPRVGSVILVKPPTRKS
jgi:hypothetical protein